MLSSQLDEAEKIDRRPNPGDSEKDSVSVTGPGRIYVVIADSIAINQLPLNPNHSPTCTNRTGYQPRTQLRLYPQQDTKPRVECIGSNRDHRTATDGDPK